MSAKQMQVRKIALNRRKLVFLRCGRFNGTKWSHPVIRPTKNAPLSTKTRVRLLNDVCLRQMMTATPNDVRFANDVCLTAHWGKHRIIAERCGATSYLRSKCIISPQAILH